MFETRSMFLYIYSELIHESTLLHARRVNRSPSECVRAVGPQAKARETEKRDEHTLSTPVPWAAAVGEAIHLSSEIDDAADGLIEL